MSILFDVHHFISNNISRKLCLNRLPASQCASAPVLYWSSVHVQQSIPTSRNTRLYFTGFVVALQSVHTLTQLSIRLGAVCYAGAYTKLVGLHADIAQKQRLVEVRADFEQTIVNKTIDQWSKQAFVTAKRQHFKHSLFVISCIVWTEKL